MIVLINKSKILFTLLTFISAIGLFLLGELYVYYTLSKEPKNAMIELIYKKCRGSVSPTEDIHDEWAMKYYTCWSEELAHVRNKAFKAEIYFKNGRYVLECDIKKENKKKCQEDVLSIYRKQLDKYREINDMMR
ncbi:hypothetical protein AVD04_17040 [Salmonella enterica subsp. enterica serovar Anatum]|nr:hypothetical protein [Salmonella enterica subsp. enterica serovar Anatum]EDV5615028.1 hypothetical protein [Salmonella enterica subsp. enterica serovar Anatum]